MSLYLLWSLYSGCFAIFRSFFTWSRTKTPIWKNSSCRRASFLAKFLWLFFRWLSFLRMQWLGISASTVSTSRTGLVIPTAEAVIRASDVGFLRAGTTGFSACLGVGFTGWIGFSENIGLWSCGSLLDCVGLSTWVVLSTWVSFWFVTELVLHIDPSEWLLFLLRFNITTETITITNTVANAAPTPAAIMMGHSVLLQGVPRISSVSASVQETVASFGVHLRVFFKTPILPQLSVHSGFVHSPNV